MGVTLDGLVLDLDAEEEKDISYATFMFADTKNQVGGFQIAFILRLHVTLLKI